MVPGPSTRSQGCAPLHDGASSSSNTPMLGCDPDNVVSEPAIPPVFSPPMPTGSNETTQLRISLEMLAAQMRWVVDEIKGMQRERSNKEEGRQSIYHDPAGAIQFTTRDLVHATMAPVSAFPHRPPLLPQPPLSQASGFLFPAPAGTPLFLTVSLPQPAIFSTGSHSQPTAFPINPGFSSLKPRPEFPLFTGKDVYNWIFRVEQLLDYYDVPYDPL